MQATAKPVALITGASRGIGRAVALKLAERYHIVAAARNAAQLHELAGVIVSGGNSCDVLPLDITSASAVADAFTPLRVDVLVNNAGAGPIRPFMALTPEQWHRMVDLNFNSLYHVTRAVLPGMIERRSGHVVNIGSIAGRSAFAGGTCYASTKHAVAAFSECLMLEVREHGIKVSVVAPGSVSTDFSPHAAEETWRLTADEVADSVAVVLNTPPDVLIHRLEIRPLSPPK